MLIDVSFNVMMVPSSSCEPRFSHCSGHPLFYGNESHTYHRSNERDFQVYALCRFYGWKSTDDVNINGLVVRDQPFIEADQINTLGFIDLYAFFDGPLALAPGQSSHSKVNSVFRSMAEQELLDENVFALRLPQGRYRLPDNENDTTPVVNNLGELTFGGVNHDLYQGDFKAIPLTTNETDRELAGAWTVEAHAATMETNDWTLSYEFNNTAARIDSAWPHIGLPDALFRQLYIKLGLQQCGAFFCLICDWRADMPDFTLTLGNGTNLTLTAFDYSLEMYRGNITQCISAFMPNGDGGRKEERPAILLGSTFLRSFYTVFDLDKREVRCKLQTSTQKKITC